VHAGWKGTAARVADAALDAMNAKPAEVRAFIGPAISWERYQVGPDVAGHFDGDVLAPDGPDHWRLDLRAANRRILIEAGVAPEHIEQHPASTGGDYFSDRAERPCGRFGVLARLEPA
jgi:copper oxidase (laccase) domain-containing protein